MEFSQPTKCEKHNKAPCCDCFVSGLQDVGKTIKQHRQEELNKYGFTEEQLDFLKRELLEK